MTSSPAPAAVAAEVQPPASEAPAPNHPAAFAEGAEPPHPISLGNTVRDVITGFEGVAVTFTQHLTGMQQIGVQPKSANGGKPERGYLIDITSLDFVDEGCANRASPPQDHTVQLGQKVEEIVTGFIGIVVEKTYHFNGCVTAKVIDRIVPGDDATGLGRYADHKYLKLIDEGISAQSTTPLLPAPSGGFGDVFEHEPIPTYG